MKTKEPLKDLIPPPYPQVWDYPPAGYGDVQRMIEIRIDTSGREPDLVVARIDYGETTSYGQVVDYGTVYRMQLSVLLESLSPNTEYHYMVTLKDPAGNTTATDDMTFQTQIDGSVTPTSTPTITVTPTPTNSPSPTSSPFLTPASTPTPPPVPAASAAGLILTLAFLSFFFSSGKK